MSHYVALCADTNRSSKSAEAMPPSAQALPRANMAVRGRGRGVYTPAEHVCARHPPHDSRSTDARRHATTDGSTAAERKARRRAA